MTDRLTIVDKLREISALLELSGGNKFKARAYARGARALEAAKMPLDKLVDEKQLESLPGIGKAIARVIEELYLTGKSPVLDALEAGMPAGVLELSQAANLGLPVLRTLSDELGIKNVDDLERAAKEGRLETVKGFGPAKTARILKAIEKYRTKPALIRLYDGLRLADSLAADLSSVKGVKNVALIGPVAEGLEMSPSLDLQITTSAPDEVVKHARFGSVERSDEKECRLRLADGTRIHLHFGPKPKLEANDDLIAREDIRGLVHCHSTWSDGRHSILEMAQAAEAAGFELITITDHSKNAFYAGGLDEDRIREQWDEIDEVQEKVGIRILKGTEADILADGAIDWPDSILERFDVIIASIHNRYKQDEAKMTARVKRALEWPGFKIWGHPLGRMVPSRPPIPLRLDEILDTVAETNSAIEINGDPIRMDLPPDIAKSARERKVPFVLGVDAHSTGNIDFLRVAVALARRAGIRKDEVLNAKPPSRSRSPFGPNRETGDRDIHLKMDRIGPNSRVVLDYTLKADGDVVDASDRGEDREPIVYIHGYGMIVPGLERALVGLIAGDTKDVTVKPEEGYGDRDEELVVEVDRSEMPRPDKVAVGDEIVAESPEGEEAALTVIDIDGDTVVLDGNHPLAGKTLHYSVIVRHVGPASHEEILEAARAFEEARAAMEPEADEMANEGLVQLRRSPKTLPN